MDNTAFLSTSRANLVRKVEILDKFSRDYGMVINSEKTKFIGIHSEDGDTGTISVSEFVSEHCRSYPYLRSLTTQRKWLSVFGR